MKQFIQKLHREGFIACTDPNGEPCLLVDLFNVQSSNFTSFGTTPFMMLFSDEAMLERTFEAIPESYFQLNEVSDKPVDALITAEIKTDRGLQKIEVQCRILNQQNNLSLFISRVRKPLVLIDKTQIQKLSNQIELPSRPENELLRVEAVDTAQSVLIRFEARGSFKIVRK